MKVYVFENSYYVGNDPVIIAKAIKSEEIAVEDGQRIEMKNNKLIVVDDDDKPSKKSLEDYRKDKLSELNAYQQSISSAPYMTTLGIKANIDEKALIMQTMGKTLSDLNGAKNVNFVDYDGNIQVMTPANYKKLCTETGNRIDALRVAYTKLKKAINDAKTIDELNDITISGK